MTEQTFMPHASLRRTARALALAALVALAFSAAPGSTAHAQRRGRRPEVGTIQITTTPGGYPISINGNPAGTTTEFARNFDLPPGSYTVEILFPNNNRWAHTFNIRAGQQECVNLNYRPRTVRFEAAPPSPCPYPVVVSAQTTANDGEVVTFSANVAYEGPSALNYTWTVSPPTARILSGAGTPTITVDTTGLGRRRVTAILVVDDGSGDRNCRQTSQASTSILAPPAPPAEPRRFDEFPSTNFDDDKARLDHMAIELQNTPGSTGYIIVYSPRPATAEALGRRSRQYLVETRGIDSSRVVVINGGYRDRNSFELWLVPAGAAPPQATPTTPSGYRRRR